MFRDKMVTTAISERIFALCKIVEKGPIASSELKEKMEPEYLENGSVYFNDYKNSYELINYYYEKIIDFFINDLQSRRPIKEILPNDISGIILGIFIVSLIPIFTLSSIGLTLNNYSIFIFSVFLTIFFGKFIHFLGTPIKKMNLTLF